MSNTLHFLHGSTAKPPVPESFEFRLFNHVKNDNEDTVDNPNVHNGVDAFGPGIYTQLVTESSDKQALLDGAQAYVGKGQGGSIMGFSLNMEPDIYDDGEPTEQPMFTNDYPPHHISVEEWADVINYMVDERRRLEHYYIDDAEALIEEAVAKWEETGEKPNEETLLAIIGEVKGVPLDEISPEDFDEPEDYRYHLADIIDLYDPASRIFQEGGPESIAQYAINTSFDLRETLNKIYNLSAVENTGKGTYSYNAAFQFAVINHVDDLRAITVARGWSPDRDEDGKPILDEHGNDPLDNGVYIVFNTAEVNMQYIQTIVHATPEYIFERIDDARADVHTAYDGHLSLDQKAMKLNEVLHNTNALTLSDETAFKIMSVRPEKPLYKGVIDLIHEELGPTRTTEWEKRPGAKHLFMPNNSEIPLRSPKMK